MGGPSAYPLMAPGSRHARADTYRVTVQLPPLYNRSVLTGFPRGRDLPPLYNRSVVSPCLQAVGSTRTPLLGRTAPGIPLLQVLLWGHPAANSRCGRSLLRAVTAGSPKRVVGVSPDRELIRGCSLPVPGSQVSQPTGLPHPVARYGKTGHDAGLTSGDVM